MASKTQDEKQFDLRVVEWRMGHGQLDPKEYEAHLKGLPDDEARAEWIEVYEEPPADELTPHADELTFTVA